VLAHPVWCASAQRASALARRWWRLGSRNSRASRRFLSTPPLFRRPAD
jgi:hypothetical protein